MKKFKKKLKLNKKIISSLNDHEMLSVNGGTNYCQSGGSTGGNEDPPSGGGSSSYSNCGTIGGGSINS